MVYGLNAMVVSEIEILAVYYYHEIGYPKCTLSLYTVEEKECVRWIRILIYPEKPFSV